MSYHLTLTNLSAMGVTAVNLNYRSLAADTASIRCPLGQEPASTLPWVEGDRLVLSDDRLPGNPRLFNGRVKSVATSLSGAAWSVQVELANDVDVLEFLTARDMFGSSRGGGSPPSHTTGRAIYGIRRFPIRG